MRLKVLLKARVILIVTAIMLFLKFYKGYDEFKEMSLDSKYNKMKEFNKHLINFKNVKTKKQETKLGMERIMKNVDNLYEKYYNVYKSDYDTNDELTKNKKEKYDNKQFELGDEINKESKLDEKNKRARTD